MNNKKVILSGFFKKFLNVKVSFVIISCCCVRVVNEEMCVF